MSWNARFYITEWIAWNIKMQVSHSDMYIYKEWWFEIKRAWTFEIYITCPWTQSAGVRTEIFPDDPELQAHMTGGEACVWLEYDDGTNITSVSVCQTLKMLWNALKFFLTQDDMALEF